MRSIAEEGEGVLAALSQLSKTEGTAPAEPAGGNTLLPS